MQFVIFILYFFVHATTIENIKKIKKKQRKQKTKQNVINLKSILAKLIIKSNIYFHLLLHANCVRVQKAKSCAGKYCEKLPESELLRAKGGGERTTPLRFGKRVN